MVKYAQTGAELGGAANVRSSVQVDTRNSNPAFAHGEENVMTSVSETNHQTNQVHHTIPNETGSVLDRSLDPAFDCNVMNMS